MPWYILRLVINICVFNQLYITSFSRHCVVVLQLAGSAIPLHERQLWEGASTINVTMIKDIYLLTKWV